MADQAIGALWIKEGPKGDYMTGNIKINDVEHRIVVFRNDRKEGKQPDWRILKAKPKQQDMEEAF